jgi:hypothetical protein
MTIEIYNKFVFIREEDMEKEEFKQDIEKKHQ